MKFKGTAEKARELINKHLYLHGGDGFGITNGDVYRAVLDAVIEAFNTVNECDMMPSELLARYNEAVEALNGLIDPLTGMVEDSFAHEIGNERVYKIEQVITKSKEQ